MPTIGDLSDLLHPFDAAAEWAKEQDAKPKASTLPAPTDPEPQGSSGSRLTPLGWAVLGVVLVGGAYLLARQATSLAFESALSRRHAQ